MASCMYEFLNSGTCDPAINWFVVAYGFAIDIFNTCCMWQYRCVDELESQLSKHGSLKKLYFYHQHLTTVSSCFLFLRLDWRPIFSIAHCIFSDSAILEIPRFHLNLAKHRFSGTPCLDLKGVLNIAVHGLVLLVVFPNVLLRLFQKRYSTIILLI